MVFNLGSTVWVPLEPFSGYYTASGLFSTVKAYSPGLHERIAAASQQPGRTVGAVAAQLSVLVSFVAKLLQRHCRV